MHYFSPTHVNCLDVICAFRTGFSVDLYYVILLSSRHHPLNNFPNANSAIVLIAITRPYSEDKSISQKFFSKMAGFVAW